ncbi:MAG: hypothetical protein N3G20_00495 [Verrucomicrobiae bacterium]|nr:hypothetical protein [Verrucomicrobiae bacterium]
MPISQVVVERIRFITDSRGFLFEPIDPESIPGQHNVHVAWTNPGSVRGNHAHKVGTETVIVTGDALVRLKENNKVTDYSVSYGEAWRFTIPPGVVHAFKCTGPKPMLLVTFNTEPHQRTTQDLTPEVLIAVDEAW